MQFKAYIYVPACQDGVVACCAPLVLATSARPGEELGLVVLAVAFEAPSCQGTPDVPDSFNIFTCKIGLLIFSISFCIIFRRVPRLQFARALDTPEWTAKKCRLGLYAPLR